MNVEVCKAHDPCCDEFILKHPEGKICHLYSWTDAVVRAARLNGYYLVARDSGNICGVLPLVQVKSRLFGNFMVSQGLSDYGGPLVTSDAARDLLIDYVTEQALRSNCSSIEFRNITSLPYNFELRAGKMCMYLPLESDFDKLWKSFKPKVRNQVRKGEKSKLIVVDGHIELLDRFYPIYSRRMHQLGTPAYSQGLMVNLLQALPENSRIFLVSLDDIPVGGALTFCFKGFVEIPFASTLTMYNPLCPNNLLYWYIIKHYCIAGAECFDFGRCTEGSSTYDFKRQWNTEPVKLNYQYWVRPGHTFNINSPENPKYRRKIELWKKLPFWLTRLIGPSISRNLP